MSLAAILAILGPALGIASTIVAWNLNPRRRLYAELDNLFNTWNALNTARDEALVKHDSDALTRITKQIIDVVMRKNEVLRRLNEKRLFDRIADMLGRVRDN